MTRLLAIPALFLAACASSPSGDEPDGPRFLAGREHVSFVAPEGWRESRERDSLVFTEGRSTIAIRSVPRDGDWVQSRTASLVFPATEKVLRALPGAEVRAPVLVRRKGFEGVSYQLTFQPHGVPHRYGRRHVTLVGVKRVIHVIHTAPAGDLDATEDELETVIASLREEV